MKINKLIFTLLFFGFNNLHIHGHVKSLHKENIFYGNKILQQIDQEYAKNLHRCMILTAGLYVAAEKFIKQTFQNKNKKLNNQKLYKLQPIVAQKIYNEIKKNSSFTNKYCNTSSFDNYSKLKNVISYNQYKNTSESL